MKAMKASKKKAVSHIRKNAQSKKVKKSVAKTPKVAANPAKSFTAKELKVLSKLNTPAKIQDFVDNLKYDGADDYFSVRSTLRTGKAHCMGGALVAACCLERLGYGPPRVVGFIAENDDSHAVAVYQKDGYWGAVGKSNFTLIRSRLPVYKTVRELMMSYMDFYFNTAREPSLVGFNKPFNLNTTGHSWKFAEGSLGEALDNFDDEEITPIIPLLPPHLRKKGGLALKKKRALGLCSKHVLKAGLLGSNPAGLYKPR